MLTTKFRDSALLFSMNELTERQFMSLSVFFHRIDRPIRKKVNTKYADRLGMRKLLSECSHRLVLHTPTVTRSSTICHKGLGFEATICAISSQFSQLVFFLVSSTEKKIRSAIDFIIELQLGNCHLQQSWKA